MADRDRLDGYFIIKRGSKGNEWYEVVRNDVDWKEWFDIEFKGRLIAWGIAIVVIAALYGLLCLVDYLFHPFDNYKEPEFLIELVQPKTIIVEPLTNFAKTNTAHLKIV